MRKIVNLTYVTLDGVIERLGEWHFGYLGGRADEIAMETLAAADTLLMGRRTYEGFAPVWPEQTGPFADRINSMEKYVASTTMTEATWANTEILADDVAGQIAKLKEQPGGDILQYGFGRLSETLLEHGLLDELRLWVHPVFAGRAQPEDLLYLGVPSVTFDLVDSEILDNGLAIMTYGPKPTGQSS